MPDNRLKDSETAPRVSPNALRERKAITETLHKKTQHELKPTTKTATTAKQQQQNNSKTATTARRQKQQNSNNKTSNNSKTAKKQLSPNTAY